MRFQLLSVLLSFFFFSCFSLQENFTQRIGICYPISSQSTTEPQSLKLEDVLVYHLLFQSKSSKLFYQILYESNDCSGLPLDIIPLSKEKSNDEHTILNSSVDNAQNIVGFELGGCGPDVNCRTQKESKEIPTSSSLNDTTPEVFTTNREDASSPVTLASLYPPIFSFSDAFSGHCKDFTLTGSIATVTISLVFPGPSDLWVSELMFGIFRTDSTSVLIGGNDVNSTNVTATQKLNWTDEWNTGRAGTYHTTIDVSAQEWNGTSNYTLCLYNGWGESDSILEH